MNQDTSGRMEYVSNRYYSYVGRLIFQTEIAMLNRGVNENRSCDATD